MKQQMRKPENWQDFESLCKVLWGEIWSCPEIKKNGRSGQTQHGVDIYGMPNGSQKYIGIQCKGKDDYSKSTLSEKEIDAEIKKAKNFKPKLEKLYFTTTANKDSGIEEYVRLKNEESMNNNGFEIHIFSWEDIVDLIDENKRTHDWYVKKLNFITQYDANVCFSSGEDTLTFNLKLIKNDVTYKWKSPELGKIGFPYVSPETNIEERLKLSYEAQPKRYYMNGESTNLSSGVFALTIENTGSETIENYKLYINFPSENVKVEIVTKQDRFLDSFEYKYSTYEYSDSNNCVFEPDENILVQLDSATTDNICIRPTIEDFQEILLEYELVARDFNKSGTLKIILDVEIEEKKSTEEVSVPRENEIRLENYLD